MAGGSDAAKKQYQAAFKVFDRDGDGAISAEETYAAMWAYDKRLTDDTARMWFRVVDTDKNGGVEEAELVNFGLKESEANTLRRQGKKEEAAKQQFRFSDVNGDGRLTWAEKSAVLAITSRGETVAWSGRRALWYEFTGADFNKDGEVSLKEFLKEAKEKEKQREKEEAAERRSWREQYQRAFHRFDRDEDGTMTVEETYAAMSAFDEALTEDAARMWVHAVDTDKNGSVEEAELVSWVLKEQDFYRLLRQGEKEEAVKHQFRFFDVDGDGRFTFTEKLAALTIMGKSQPVSDSERGTFRRQFYDSDFNNDGVVSLGEYLKDYGIGDGEDKEKVEESSTSSFEARLADHLPEEAQAELQAESKAVRLFSELPPRPAIDEPSSTATLAVSPPGVWLLAVAIPLLLVLALWGLGRRNGMRRARGAAGTAKGSLTDNDGREEGKATLLVE